jgi:dimethylargininase
MEQFEQVIVRTPCENFADGITPGFLGRADAALAKEQHKGYIEALKKCSVKVIVLDEDNDYPDSCFVEDPAIVTDRVVIMTDFCAPSRKGEEQRILSVLTAIYGKKIEWIKAPGTVEGGDICQVGNHFYIGLSRRTNDEGARQLSEILKKYGFTGSTINIRNYKTVLHLKTGMSYLGNHTFISLPEIAGDPELKDYTKIIVTPEEGYASNCIRVNDYVLIPKGFNRAIGQVEAAGFKTIPVAMSEFEKQDGGLSCLSLRIPKLNL